jgi:hypothetical protein
MEQFEATCTNHLLESLFSFPSSTEMLNELNLVRMHFQTMNKIIKSKKEKGKGFRVMKKLIHGKSSQIPKCCYQSVTSSFIRYSLLA